MANDSRAQILGRIRAANGGASTSAAAAAARIGHLPAYRSGSAKSSTELLCLLRDRLHDYDAQVLEAEPYNVRALIGEMLRARGLSRILLPEGFPPHLLPDGFNFVPDSNLPLPQLDGCEGVLTLCTVAIAETGTIVLQNVPGQGRRAATLVPDYHLCIVDALQIVESVPEAFAILQPTAHLPTTFISGPSATADIEMTRIKGVHGPRFLDVILQRAPTPSAA